MHTSRFTLDGSGDLECHLQKVCTQTAKEVRDLIPEHLIQALLLGGGYGRGEGGVLRESAQDLPYNDLEFYLCLKGPVALNTKKFSHPIHLLAEALTQLAGIEVEFKITSVEKIAASQPSMFFYDLVAGHKLLLGSASHYSSAWEHHRDATRIPLHEASRLLLNRCSGLLYSKNLLTQNDRSAEARDFINRNVAKAQLALGDALLTCVQQYTGRCSERNQRLHAFSSSQFPAWLAAVRQHHDAGVAFKLHPNRGTQPFPAVQARFEELQHLSEKVWLWLEEKRLGIPFSSSATYGRDPRPKCPETAALKNLLINLRTFRLRGIFHPMRGRYPRERLYKSLPLLLWGAGALDPHSIPFLQAQLNSQATEFPGLVEDYRRLWNQFN